MQKKINWTAIGLGVLMVGAIGAPFIANNQAEDNAGSIDNIATQLTALDEKIDAGISVDVALDEGVLTTEIHDKLFEDDAWEAEAEVIASEEWEERDYKDIYKAINNLYGGFDDDGNLVEKEIDNRDDIDYVVVKDTSYPSMNADDKDGTVIQELKVKYEDSNGNKQKVYLTVETIIDEGEIEDQEITKTD